MESDAYLNEEVIRKILLDGGIDPAKTIENPFEGWCSGCLEPILEAGQVNGVFRKRAFESL